jgi:membrane protease YdiL (CAAX protease family)
MKKSAFVSDEKKIDHAYSDPSFQEEAVPFRRLPGVLLLSHAILSIILQIVWTSTNSDAWLRSGMSGYVFSGILMQSVCILMPVLFVLYRYHVDAKIAIGQSRGYGGGIILSLTIGIPAGVVFTGLNNGFIYMLSRFGISFPSSLLSSADLPLNISTLPIFIMIGAFLPGIIEELLFRGVMQGAMEKQGGRVSAILFPALAFAAFHADPLFILAPFLAGLLLGFLRKKTGSIYPAVLAHISMNMTVLFITPILPRITSEYLTTMTSNAVLYASLLASAVASVALIPMIIVFSSIYTANPHPRTKLVPFPFDYTYVIAMIILTSNLLYLYFNSV